MIVSFCSVILNMLNDIYQSIIMVTGASPDLERDYNIQKEVPTLLDNIKTAREKVANIGKSISKVSKPKNWLKLWETLTCLF